MRDKYYLVTSTSERIQQKEKLKGKRDYVVADRVEREKKQHLVFLFFGFHFKYWQRYIEPSKLVSAADIEGAAVTTLSQPSPTPRRRKRAE